jgi:hypothetical protein
MNANSQRLGLSLVLRGDLVSQLPASDKKDPSSELDKKPSGDKPSSFPQGGEEDSYQPSNISKDPFLESKQNLRKIGEKAGYIVQKWEKGTLTEVEAIEHLGLKPNQNPRKQLMALSLEPDPERRGALLMILQTGSKDKRVYIEAPEQRPTASATNKIINGDRSVLEIKAGISSSNITGSYALDEQGNLQYTLETTGSSLSGKYLNSQTPGSKDSNIELNLDWNTSTARIIVR